MNDIQRIIQAIPRVDLWLRTMRSPDGYAGPVVHWWQNCLHFTGAGIDWRYEGIVSGYINLYHSTGNSDWLLQACNAGNDIIRGQLASGHFRNSNFEANPNPCGTPHEAACSLALLAIAHELRIIRSSDWNRYFRAAELNLQALIKDVWVNDQQYFSNSSGSTQFVPNKAATIVELLFAWSKFTNTDELVYTHVRPTLDAIIDCQVKSNDKLDGAIDQSRIGTHLTSMYFPLYIARCIPALLQGADWLNCQAYREAACSAMAFVLRTRLADGSFPQIVYRNGRVRRYPQWIAGVGDMLRAMDLASRSGMDIVIEPTVIWLLGGLEATGGWRTAHGFAAERGQIPNKLDPRDLIPVCGWVDKAFRWLTSRLPRNTVIPSAEIGIYEQDCLLHGKPVQYYESATEISMRSQGNLIYRWQKGRNWSDQVINCG